MKRREGGQRRGKKEREKKDLESKIMNRVDESSVVGCVGRFFFTVRRSDKNSDGDSLQEN